MASDSISVSSNPRDFSKKKRANRSAKLKQCKLDARREQWLSQGKSMASKDGNYGDAHPEIESNRSSSVKDLQINPIGVDHYGSKDPFSDSESFSNSPNSLNGSVFGGNDSSTNFTGSSRSSCSRSSNDWCCSGSITEDDDCFDDWEAVADALAEQERHDLMHEPPLAQGNAVHQNIRSCLEAETVQVKGRAPVNCRAWMPDDVFRPQTLPNLSKQNSFPMNSNRQHGHGGIIRPCINLMSVPSSCPICCEDLDLTDSSFIPCLCGFRLCLFCHKRILEADGRCPGCRKHYDCSLVERDATLDGSGQTFGLARSYSMVSRMHHLFHDNRK